MKLFIHSQTLMAKVLNFGKDKKFHPTLYWACEYLSMSWLKLNHYSKRAPGGLVGTNNLLPSQHCQVTVTHVNIVHGTRLHMMTSADGNIFRVTGLSCREFTGHRWIPHTKASDAELWCFLWSAPEPTVEQTIETPMIYAPSRSSWRHFNEIRYNDSL